ncbi:MAG: translation elongation factor 4 [Synergistetes bacterium]|nr:translation elongation factor 4 [Synergistota bacterium]
MDNIRNFCIIAHIDHGKSTLADRFLSITKTIPERKMVEQVLDMMDIERERGITIKAQPVRMQYQAEDGNNYTLNLIDTPGHVDFEYEVSKSMAACEGALLVIDATQGIEAQTLANAYLAVDANLEIIPVINKIDLPSADPDRVKREIKEVLGLDAQNSLLVSAKDGTGVKAVLEAIVRQIPSPKGSPNAPLKALIFDAVFDSFKGVIVYARIFDGNVKKGDKIEIFSNHKTFEVEEVGVFKPNMTPKESLSAGEVGYIIANIKNIGDTRVGDTIMLAEKPLKEPLPGYKRVKPVVFCGFYPIERESYPALRDALQKLQLNDAAFTYTPENSVALGFGFRCGFLGMLHMDIIKERLKREFGLELVATVPNVIYKVGLKNGTEVEINNPAMFPPIGEIEYIKEPYTRVTVFTPSEFIGPIMKVVQNKRGTYIEMQYVNPTRAMLTYEIPLSEIILDFHDKVKSVSRGYASFDYEQIGYRISELLKVDILINGEPVDALSFIVHKDHAYHKSQMLLDKLKEHIPRQLFDVNLQAAIGKRVISKRVIKALRKDVLAKCYGGDVTRKKKLLEKQKEGKKKMKQIGRVNIPQDAFLAFLKINE